MRIVHPLWRGFYLALCSVAALVLLPGVDELSPYRFDRRMLALAGAVLVGAFLGALPARFRKRRPHPYQTSWQRCLRAFLCGVAMALAYGMAGSGGVLSALLTGSTGAYAFWGMALATGFITVRIAGRRRRA